MGKKNFLKNRFTAGEISPKAYSRVDLLRYETGAKSIQNFTVMAHGGLESRPGTRFVAEVKDSSKSTRLIRFEFNVEQAYAIEIGHQYMRFYKDGEQIRDTATTITGATQANPCVVTDTGHPYLDGDHIYIDSIVGMTELNSVTRRYTIANKTANTYELSGIDSTSFTAYSSAGNAQKPTEISTDYIQTDLFDIQFVQSADIIYLVHGDHAPHQLGRTSDTSWTLTPLMKDSLATGATLAILDGPYLDENTTTTTLTPAAATGSGIVVTASSIVGINGGDGFKSTDVGRLVRMLHGTTWGYAEIVSFSTTTSITVDIKRDFGGTGAVSEWRLGAWSDTTGFPQSITFYEDRLMFAATNKSGAADAQPDTIWGSNQSDYLNFGEIKDSGTAIGDSDPVTFTLNSQEINVIQWMSPHSTLRIGTAGSTMSVSGSTTSTSLTPTNVKSERNTSVRCSNIRPIIVNNSTLFWDRSKRAFLDLKFKFEDDALVSDEVSLISEHITSGGVIESDFEQRPDNIIWSIREDGQMVGTTWRPTEEIIGWHRHVFGGADTKAKSVATVPTSANDRTWLIISRTIDSSTKQYVEYISDRYNASTITTNSHEVPEDAVFSDSAFIYTGEEPAATLTPGATTGTGITFTAGSAVFASTDVGRNIRSSTAKAIITGFTSSTVVTASIVEDFSSTSAISSGDWTLSTISLTDLYHLEGETLTVLAEGGVHPDVTVSGGSITLEQQSTNITLGLRYTREVDLLDLEGGGFFGSIKGSRSDAIKAIIEVLESVGFSLGRDSSNTKPEEFRKTSDVMDLGTPVFSGYKEITPITGYSDTVKIYISQNDPLPLTILGIIIKGIASDTT